MPFYRKKRRHKPGPSKNEMKVWRGREAERQVRSAGTLRERFPWVQKLTVQLDFFTPQQLLLEKESRMFGPPDPCLFSAPCPGRCGGRGSFDLAAKVQAVVESRQPQGTGAGVCRELLYPGSAEICGFRLQCRIDALYEAGA